MAEDTGLRFDLYERVRLPEELPAIGDLEQIELLPFVQGSTGEGNPQLKGYLQLTAVYVPEGAGGEVRSYNHRIPVEITLPARTADGIGDIRVEIEQFDVELVSDRSLNVTGVLALSGLPQNREDTRGTEGGEDGGGEIVAIHRVKKKPASEQVQAVIAEPAAFEWQAPPSPAADAASGPPERPGAKHGDAAKKDGDLPGGDAVPANAAPEPEAPVQTTPDAGDWPEAEPASAAPADGELLDADDWLDDEFPDGRKPKEDAAHGVSGAAEPKVAFKPLDEPEDGQDSAEAHASAGTRNNELDWQKLFLGNRGEEQFRTIRMCIVQKDETIETIAERYRLNPREIALYNRLSDNGLSEGQILDIPVT